jgi:hypothetical protein
MARKSTFCDARPVNNTADQHVITRADESSRRMFANGLFSLKFWPVRVSSLCQVNTLAIAKTDKNKKQQRAGCCRMREKSSDAFLDL